MLKNNLKNQFFLVRKILKKSKILITSLSFSLVLSSCIEWNFIGKNNNKKIDDKKNNSQTLLMASKNFVRGSDDIPLLLSMQELLDDDIGFDSNSGSIISVSYFFEEDWNNVKFFYIKSLPQMGWTVKSSLENKITFKRDNENLDIVFSKKDDKKIINFFISSSTMN